ncbi:MAG: UDP-N-acetylmuramoyl-L-alanyl-D-glutamate--2,6-diaminopimelate ligase [Hyphomicrobiaceae bacterium]
MNLADLMPSGATVTGDVDGIEIVAITADSRQAADGVLFAAMPGTRVDGAHFVPDALANGAAAVLAADSAVLDDCPVPVVRSSDPRRALALMAAKFYGRQPENAVAVTGTSGKTSVADFTRQIFGALGHQAASMGTIGIVRPDGGVYGSLTTPDPVTLHGVIAGLADDGVTHLAFEASSHGLDQRRLDGVVLKAAAFTNLGRDHLDYHPTVEHYLAAKRRLFDTLLPEGAAAVINSDDPHAQEFLEAARQRKQSVLTVGHADGTSLQLLASEPSGFTQQIRFSHGGREHTATLNLIGTYQASNALMAAGLALACDEEPAAVFAALHELAGVSGRLEVVGEAHGATIVVDYAHKPDALSAALDALRPFAPGRLISVFGCGGDRDPGKRPIMGRISADKADLTIITDDNPRTEDPAAVRAAILGSAPGAEEIPDRFEAIASAISRARPGDVVLIAGKGHETGQIVGDKVLPFSDHEAVAAVLREF